MNNWIEYFYISIFSAALLLSTLGLWFTSIIPGIDSWSKRFFRIFFINFILCCLSNIVETLFIQYPVPHAAIYCILFLESLFLSVPLPMLTVYLLHCCGEDIRRSRLMQVVMGLWALYCVMLVVALFIDGFIYIGSGNQYTRGPLYPLVLVPMIVILLLNLGSAIHRQRKLSRKVFSSYLIAILPMTVTLILQVFFDVFPLLDISYVLAALSMYSFALSDQIERDLQRQREIARQQQEIANQRISIMVLQMRPHFIYNTLMSIYSLCNLDPQKARQVTMDFTNYLRKNFNAVTSEGTIPFSAELEHTRAYLAVEQTQHEDLLVVDYDMQFTHFRLPPLTLQPIVENSVKHGINPYSGPLHISIRTQHTDSGSEIIVEDNGPGFDPFDESKPYTTLTNIKQRLDMMCGGSMDIQSHEGEGTVVKITIPPAQPSSE